MSTVTVAFVCIFSAEEKTIKQVICEIYVVIWLQDNTTIMHSHGFDNGTLICDVMSTLLKYQTEMPYAMNT